MEEKMTDLGPQPDYANDTISLHEALSIFTKRWKYLVILALLFILGALVKHKFFPTYPARGVLLIKDVKNSRYQLLLNSIANRLGEFAPDEAQESDEVSQGINLLETHRFHVRLAKRIFEFYEEEKDSQESFELLIGKILKIENEKLRTLRMAQVLRSLLHYSNEGEGRLKISLKTKNKVLSYNLVSLAIEEAREELITREIFELEQAEKYFSEEIQKVQIQLDEIEKQTINKMQEHQVLSVDIEKGEASRYVNELKQSISDTSIAIKKNKNLIRDLQRKINKANAVTSQGKFSGASQIRNLKAENKDYRAKLRSLQSTLKNYERKQKGLLPFQQEIEKMKAKYTYEYKVYESLRSSLAKIGLEKTYIKNKVEVLEPEFVERITSKPGLMVMVFLALMLSQVLGLGGIYLYELFRP
mgnify:CR=1 FL=1